MIKLFLLLAAALTLWAAEPSPPKLHTATVTETMDAGGYTYMKVAEGEKTYWVAVQATPVRVGAQVSFAEQMWMPDFKSRSLNRTFDRILFASMVRAPGGAAAEAVRPAGAPKQVLQKAEGGYSVAEVFAKRQTLKGKTVRVRGKITKISRQIMKRNWVHIEDGTGGAMSDDLVFTTAQPLTVKAGDIVVAEGKAETDKDFGYGYFYPVIIEESRFATER